ncbi:MAG TPA: hypothetical protein VLR26_02265 [Frankiaceae bacterium]|nr:hypothetical protein [Frankiaceae bacterium]
MPEFLVVMLAEAAALVLVGLVTAVLRQIAGKFAESESALG